VLVITTLLPHLARHHDLQIRMLTGRAIARATALPISEAHVDAWLGNRAILANRQQLQPTRQALRAAEVLSNGLAIAMKQQNSDGSPLHSAARPVPISARRGTHAATVARDIAEQAHQAQQYDLRL
jgi:hypothetical protein